MATKKLPDLVEIVSVESSDLLLVRDLTDGIDKKCTVDTLLASRIGGDSGSTSNFVLIADGTGGKSLKAATHVVIDNDGQLSIGSDTANAMLDITCKDVSTIGLKIKAAENQTEDILKIVSYDETTLFVINSQGDLGVTIETPNEPLHVQSDYNGNRAIRMGNEDEGDLAVARFIADVYGGSVFFAGYGANFTTVGSKRALSGSLIANNNMSGGLSLVARHPTTGHLRFYSGGNTDSEERGIITAVGRWGINVIDPDSQLEIASSSADLSALHLKAAASQTEDIFVVTDSADATLVNITKGGKIQTNAGVKAIGNQWGDCFVGWRYQGGDPEHTISNNTGYYDWTGSSYGENLFYDTVNSPFTANDALNHNFIVINSGDKQGAKAEILHYIDASRVIICCCGQAWNSDLSGVNYSIMKAPEVIFGDGPASHVHVGMFGGFRVNNSEGVFYGAAVTGFDCRSGMASRKTVYINQNANGYDRCDALEINYISGDLQSGSIGHGIHINIDESGATAGHIDGIIINSTNVSSATKGGVHIGPGFNHAFSVTGSPTLDPDYGYEITGSTVVDRVNSGGAGDDAFVNPAVNQTLWDNDNDYILIGSSNKFEVIESIFGTVSNKDLLFNFFYSKTGGGWTQFYPYDGTNGGTKSGLIYFPAPGDWTPDDQAVVNGDITNAYYIKIQRTYNFVVSVLPIEAYFKIYEEQIGETGMEIRGNGVVKLPYLTTYTPSENGDVWMESDGLHIYYNGVEKVVAGV